MPTLKNPGLLEFDAVIQPGDGGGAFVEFPFSSEELFGVARARIPVNATFDGVPYRGSMVVMGCLVDGRPVHLLLMLKEIRQRLQKRPGDTVHVSLTLDDAPRTVEVPDDVQMALNSSAAADQFFAKLAFTGKREYIGWVQSAKTTETRRRRILQMVKLLEKGCKEPADHARLT